MFTKTKIEDVEIKTQAGQYGSSDDSQGQTSRLKQILRPMLYALALAGNYNFTDIYDLKENSNFKCVLSLIYRIFYFIAIITFLIKASASFFYLPSQSFRFITLSIQWTVFLIGVCLYSFKATSSKFGHYEKVFQFWDEKIVPKFQEHGIKYPEVKMQRRVMVILTVVGIIFVINFINTGISVRVNGGFPYTAPFESNGVTLTIHFVLLTAGSLVWTIPAAFVIIFSNIIQEAFMALTDHQMKLLRQNSCTISEDFKKLRLLHLDLCQLVSDLDMDFCWFYGILFSSFTGLGVFTLYHIITGSLSTFELLMLLFWLICGIIGIGLPATYAALVNEAAHSPLDTIYYLNVQDITQENAAQLNMFLSKLTGTQVGFTMCGLLIITKEFILTIAGAYLTYFAVLYTL